MKLRLWAMVATAVAALAGFGLQAPWHGVPVARAGAFGAVAAESAPFQTQIGIEIEIPSSIPIDWSEQWTYSPDGLRMAFSSLGSIWIWTRTTDEVQQLSPRVVDEGDGVLFKRYLWADDTHIIVEETRHSLAESEAFRGDHDLPFPAIMTHWILLDIRTGEPIRRVEGQGNGEQLVVVGAVDRDIWYVRAHDNKLRILDSRTGELGAEEFFDYGAGMGYAAQLGPGSPWFSTLVPHDPADPAFGRLEVFNIQTGARRSVSDIYAPIAPALVTLDGRYLFVTLQGSDGALVPRMRDLVLNTDIPLPPGERWGPWVLSTSRGVLLVGIPHLVSPPHRYSWHYAEVSLSDILQL